MGEIIDRRTAGVETDFARVDRFKFLLLFGEGIVEPHRISNTE